MIVRLKHPSLSPASESAPHCRTTADGEYDSITFEMIGSKTLAKLRSSMPLSRGTFTA